MHRRRAVIPSLAACLVVGWLISPEAASAATVRHVSTTGIDTGDCTISPCRTIQYAIGQSSPGDLIKIAPGAYIENVIVDRSLTLKGAAAHSTIIDGSHSGTVVRIGASFTSLTVTITRLTIRHGQAETGAGIASVPGSGKTNRVTLERTAIAANAAIGQPLVAAFGGEASTTMPTAN
jgi:nitrous oxidase accessory protein NosD